MVESRSCDSTNAIPPQWQFRRKITQNRRDSTTIIPLICDSTTIIPHGGIIVVESPKLYQRVGKYIDTIGSQLHNALIGGE
jgi:hypothetical protein